MLNVQQVCETSYVFFVIYLNEKDACDSIKVTNQICHRHVSVVIGSLTPPESVCHQTNITLYMHARNVPEHLLHGVVQESVSKSSRTFLG